MILILCFFGKEAGLVFFFFFQTILKCCEKIKHSWRSWIGVRNLSLKRNHISLKTGKITPNKSQIDKTIRYYSQFYMEISLYLLTPNLKIAKMCVWPFWDTMHYMGQYFPCPPDKNVWVQLLFQMKCSKEPIYAIRHTPLYKYYDHFTLHICT